MLPHSHQRRLEKYKTYLAKFKKCLDVNNSVVHLIIKDVDTMFENVDHSNTDMSGTNGTESFGCNYNNCEITSLKQHKMQHDVEKVCNQYVSCDRINETLKNSYCFFYPFDLEVLVNKRC